MHEDLLSELIITDLYSVYSNFSGEGLKGRRQNRERWALMYKATGRTSYTCCGETFICDALHPLLVPRGCNYEWISLEGGEFLNVEFQSELTLDCILPLTLSSSETFTAAMSDLISRWRHDRPLRKPSCIRDLYVLLLKVLKSDFKSYRPGEQQLKIQPAVEYIIEHYSDNLKNDDLAHLTGLSTVYFRKVFTEVYGMPPIAYIHALRIRRAKEILKSDYGSITNVAQSLGYSSIYDFSRAFKNHTGVSPTAYLKKQKR